MIKKQPKIIVEMSPSQFELFQTLGNVVIEENKYYNLPQCFKRIGDTLEFEMLSEGIHNEVVYVVSIATGQYDGYRENVEFVTSDKVVAEKWVNKYNRIAGLARERFSNYYVGDDNYEKPEPFLYSFIVYSDPCASFEEIKVR